MSPLPSPITEIYQHILIVKLITLTLLRLNQTVKLLSENTFTPGSEPDKVRRDPGDLVCILFY